jgi:hypothetical protein
MRQIHLMSLLVVCLGCAILRVQGQSTLSAPSTPELQLTTELIDAEFCGSDYLRLQLRLRYFNNSNQPIILSRQSNAIMTYFISRTVKDAESQKYEQKYSPMQAPVAVPELVDTDALSEQTFVILKPASSYEVTAQADFPFIYDGKDHDPDLLRPGQHILEIRVQTWPAQRDVIAKLRERWGTHGYLWTQSIVSRPMSFNIPERRQVVKCT